MYIHIYIYIQMLFVYLVFQVINKLPTTNSIGEILLTISRAPVATCLVVYTICIYIYIANAIALETESQ